LGHVTRKILSEMTYSVSSGTLNPTIPYHREDALYKWSRLLHIVHVQPAH